jgi:heterodisulfide reductase subunit C
MKNDKTIQVNFENRRLLEEIIGGNHVSYCYQCGACVGDCPTARFFEDFNPREIMLRSLMGDIDELTKPDSIIWNCSNCYNCYERCPQDVRPVEVIIALKNISARGNSAPEDINQVTKRINETGFSVPIMDSTNKLREQFGLKPIKRYIGDELIKITKKDPEEDE